MAIRAIFRRSRKRSDDAAPAPLAVAYRGGANDITPLVLQTILFNVTTLTLYRFWSRTRVRRHLWSRFEIEGDALEYAGRGREMLLGFLIVLVVALIPLAAAAAALQLWNPLAPILLYPIPAFLIGVALYRARAYRLSRTLWRGVRFAQTGSAVGYATHALGWSVLSTISFGLFSPMKEAALYRYQMKRSHFGDRTFEYTGPSAPLYGPYLLAWTARIVLAVVLVPLGVAVFAGIGALLGVVFDLGFDDAENVESALQPIAAIGIAAVAYLALALTLALIQTPMAWYFAAQFNHFARHTRIDGIGFRMRATGASVAGLVIGNTFIMALTIGLGRPFTQMRTFRYVASRLETEGEIDLSAIGPSPYVRPGAGEGLADAFDVGAV